MLNTARIAAAGLALVGATTACGHSLAARAATACPQQIPAATAPTTIRWWVAPIDQKNLARLADQFNASHPAIRVLVEGIDLHQWLTAIHDHQPLPDLMNLNAPFIQVGIDSGTLTPIQDCIGAARYSLGDFIPASVASSQIGGRQWGLPLGYPPTVLLYDTTAFARAGISRPPATIDELQQDAKALQAVGIVHPIADYWTAVQPEITGVPIVDRANGHTGRATRSVFDSPRGVRLVEAFQTIGRSGAVDLPGPPPPGPPTATDPNPELRDVRELTTGQAAITMHGGWDLPDIDAMNAAGGHIALAPLPTLSGPAALWEPSPSMLLSSRSTIGQRAAAWQFVQWVEDPAQQPTEFFPTRRSVTRAGRGMQQLWDMTKQDPATPPGPISGIDSALGPVIGPAFYGFPTVAPLPGPAAAARVQAEIDQLLADYNADPVVFTLLHLGR